MVTNSGSGGGDKEDALQIHMALTATAIFTVAATAIAAIAATAATAATTAAASHIEYW